MASRRRYRTIVGATQRCAPLFARLLLLETRAAAPWLPRSRLAHEPGHGFRGALARHPVNAARQIRKPARLGNGQPQ
jgi:hypothetical protein